MIDIVKKGTPYPQRAFIVTCPRCGSSLSFRGEEVQQATDFGYIVCPICVGSGDDWSGWVNVKDAKPL